MVEEQLRERDIRDPRVLEAMARVPRHLFIPPEYRDHAYADGPLPIGESQTISQPYIVALMTQMLALQGEEKVLEIGTGSGYQAAVLSFLGREVHTVERFPDLAERAVRVFDSLHLDNIFIHVGDGSLGWPGNAPYGAIIVTAAAPRAPQPLLDQLAEGGRLVVPVGGYGGQYLELWERHGPDFTHEALAPVAFVPLRGQYGWDEERW
jgi:protein-L-isoaspartate(D-aspartate) O-methyltransferase